MNRAAWEQRLTALWYGDSILRWPLMPLSGIFRLLTAARRAAYRTGLLRSCKLPARVIVVGNISVGGTGKTPLVIALCRTLSQRGWRVGVVTGAYRARDRRRVQPVVADSDPCRVGDEAVLIARRTGVPVYSGVNRVAAGRALLKTHDCNLVISDDGLQHYVLRRDIEIALVDAARGFGNGHCLPAGPLREPPARLRDVDRVVSVGVSRLSDRGLRLRIGDARRIDDPDERRALQEFRGQRVHALAGIANPQRFFDVLSEAGISYIPHPFADHHCYRAADLAFPDRAPVLMTEKDAVKCESFARPGWWFVPIDLQLDADFADWLQTRLENAG